MRSRATTNLAVGIAKAAGTELRAFAAHFGLTPSTEAALSKGAGRRRGGRQPVLTRSCPTTPSWRG
ncbi:hypothetical protein [Saccharopolyspora sp. NPDC050642]|uniref:hypothetical protein n=1 Tax=Saccharopolyspora sp. NPDC050642 TaxID=3157099 RepID=UPI0033D227C4